MSKAPIYDKELTDAEAFAFEINEHDAKQFPVLNTPKAITVSTQNVSGKHGAFGNIIAETTVSISFGRCLTLKQDNARWYANFQSDLTFGTKWPQESNVCCVDVELHRVQGTFNSQRP